jgi:4-methylaminobutanoate oxidase (formaldehyde-forming)
MIQLRRTAATAEAFGLDCAMMTPAEALDRWPVMQVDDLLGAIWLPGDGKANPTDLTMALAKGARNRGVRIVEHTRVVDVLTQRGAVTGVRTDRGDIEVEVVVNCAGQWAAQVGAMAGVNVPLHSAEHFYVVTDQVDGVHPDLPILRDPDGYTYFKEEVGGLVVGGFEPQAKPWVSPDAVPYPFEFRLLEEDWEHFSVLMDSALHRIPVLQETGIRKFYNGPESFTPDNQFLMGEAPNLRGFFVGAGFNSVGIATAGGAGRALAEWVVEGEPTTDLVAGDLRRFGDFTGNHRWLRDRVVEILGLHYAIPWPNRELETARPFRHRCTTGWPTGTPASEAGWGGSDRTTSPPRARTRRSSTRGASRAGCPGRPRSNGPPATRWRCSTRRRSRSSWCWDGMPRRRCSGSARTTSRSTWVRWSTPAC